MKLNQIGLLASFALAFFAVPVNAAPCLKVTLTGTQGGPALISSETASR